MRENNYMFNKKGCPKWNSLFKKEMEKFLLYDHLMRK